MFYRGVPGVDGYFSWQWFNAAACTAAGSIGVSLATFPRFFAFVEAYR